MRERAEESMPKALSDRLLTERLPSELLIYDLDRNAVHCLNRTAALIWRSCDGKTTKREMADLLGQEVKTQVDEEVVWYALDQLRAARLLHEAGLSAGEKSRVSRREIMKRLGRITAIALPVVKSIVAPTAAESATCLPTGAACISSPQCCSGLCQLNNTCA